MSIYIYSIYFRGRFSPRIVPLLKMAQLPGLCRWLPSSPWYSLRWGWTLEGWWSPSQVVICCRIKPPTSRVLKDGWLIRSEFDPFSFFRVLQPSFHAGVDMASLRNESRATQEILNVLLGCTVIFNGFVWQTPCSATHESKREMKGHHSLDPQQGEMKEK